MIYRNRARRAATAIIFGWIALRLTWLWPGHEAPDGAPPPVAHGAKSVAVRGNDAQRSPAGNPHVPEPLVGRRDLSKPHQLARWSASRTKAASVVTVAMAGASFHPDATPLFGIAANGADTSNIISLTGLALADPVAETARLRAAFSGRIALPAQRNLSRLSLSDLSLSDLSLSDLSLSAWSIVRASGKARTLATSSALGASQAGIRARLDLIEPGVGAIVAANLRLSTPLHGPSGREAAAGISLRPRRAIPVELIAETRRALDAGGRDRLAVLVAGGVSELSLPRGLRLNAYGQAGVVGLRDPDSFVDGAAIVERPLRMGRAVGVPAISFGIALAGGAQPGAARLDFGPELALKQPLGHGGLRLSGGYRWRVAGRARPGSGPALTIGVNF